MDYFVYAFLIALANNVDNLGARIAYSIHGVKISTLVNLWIAVITFIISTASASSGAFVAGSLGTKAASVTAMVLLVALGFWLILRGWKKPNHHSWNTKLWAIFDTDLSKHIDFKEGTVLGIALSVNNIGGGLSAGMIGINAYFVGLLSAILSFVALWAGNHLADFFIRRHIADKAAVISGLLLIAIGIKQVIG
jgi:putative Mn2+ efflux pump MntP